MAEGATRRNKGQLEILQAGDTYVSTHVRIREHTFLHVGSHVQAHTYTHNLFAPEGAHKHTHPYTHMGTYVYPHLIYTDQQMQRPGKDVCGKEEEFSVKEGFLGTYLYLMGSPHSQDKRL